MSFKSERGVKNISLEKYLGSGDTVDVYDLEDYVVKIIKKDAEIGEDIFSEDDCKYFSEFESFLETVILPTAPYYNSNGKYDGYIQRKCRSGEIRLFDENSYILIENMKLLKSDITSVLNPAWIVGGDWNYENVIYDSFSKRMFLPDPGIYTVERDSSAKEIARENEKNFEELGDDLFEVEFINILENSREAARASLLMRKDAKKYGGSFDLFKRDYAEMPLDFETPSSYAIDYCNHQAMMKRL